MKQNLKDITARHGVQTKDRSSHTEAEDLFSLFCNLCLLLIKS